MTSFEFFSNRLVRGMLEISKCQRPIFLKIGFEKDDGGKMSEWRIETVVTGLLVVSVTVFVLGKMQNEKIARSMYWIFER